MFIQVDIFFSCIDKIIIKTFSLIFLQFCEVLINLRLKIFFFRVLNSFFILVYAPGDHSTILVFRYKIHKEREVEFFFPDNDERERERSPFLINGGKRGEISYKIIVGRGFSLPSKLWEIYQLVQLIHGNIHLCPYFIYMQGCSPIQRKPHYN